MRRCARHTFNAEIIGVLRSLQTVCKSGRKQTEELFKGSEFYIIGKEMEAKPECFNPFSSDITVPGKVKSRAGVLFSLFVFFSCLFCFLYHFPPLSCFFSSN